VPGADGGGGGGAGGQGYAQAEQVRKQALRSQPGRTTAPVSTHLMLTFCGRASNSVLAWCVPHSILLLLCMCCSRQGRQPGWLFDDADAAEAAANRFFQQTAATDQFTARGSAAQDPASRRTPPGGMFSTPPNSSTGLFARPSSNAAPANGNGGAYGSVPPPSRGGAWGPAGGAAGGDCLPAGGPWDRLRITQKLLHCVGPELSACELCLLAIGCVLRSWGSHARAASASVPAFSLHVTRKTPSELSCKPPL
jgi:hypothetical protein